MAFINSTKGKIIVTATLIVIAFVSCFVLAGHFSSPETYSGIIESLDGKRDTVLALTASSTAASVALSAIPGEACAPMAERFADLSGYFLVIMTAIILEKYLLTTFGFITFAVIIPVCCVLYLISLYIDPQSNYRRSFTKLSTKLLLLGIVFVLTVPLSVFLSDKIEATYNQSINQTIESAEAVVGIAEEATEEVERAEATNPLEFIQQRFEDLQDAAGKAIGAIGEGASWLQGVVGDFVETIAVLLVVSCIIPILVLVLLLWATKLILGLNVDLSLSKVKGMQLSKMVGKKRLKV